MICVATAPHNKVVSLEFEIEFLKRISAEAGSLALDYQRKGVSAEIKDDDSPVTAADKACEKLLVEAISREFPDDGILGEEGASKPSKSGRKWIIDPIDGTRDFLRGLPLWAVLIGLEQDGKVIAGAANCPTQNTLAWASEGGGSFVNGNPVHVSAIQELSQSVLCFNGFHKANVPAMGQPLLDWVGNCWAVRGLGGAMDAIFVAMGKADIWIEPNAKPWDFAPLKIIVEEAGGRFSSFNGENSIYNGNGYACTPAVEPFIKQLFK